MYMSLQEKLGQELYDQVIEKLGDEKIAIVSDGSYIPKQKFDDKNDEVKQLKQQLADRDNDLESLRKKAKDNEELQQEIDDLKQQYDDTKKEYEDKIKQQTFNYELEKALRNAKVRDPKDVVGQLDKDRLKLDGDKILGLDEQINHLKENKEYLFEPDEPQEPKLKGREPHAPKGEPKGITKEQFAQMGYKERAELYNSDPETYKQLTN